MTWPITWRKYDIVAVCLALAVAMAAVFLPFRQAAFIICAGLAGLVMACRPFWLLLMLPILVPFNYAFTIPAGGLRIGLVEIAVAALVGVWLAKGVAERAIKIRFSGIFYFFFVWLWVITLSLLSATAISASLGELVKWVEVAIVALAIFNLTSDSERRWLIYSVTAAVVISALIGLAQFISGRGPAEFILFGRFMRAYGTFEQPNPYAAHLGLSLPFALAWALCAKRAWWERVLLLGSSGIILAALFASWSRGGWLGIATAMAVMALLWSPKWSILLAALGLSLALLLGIDLSSSILAGRLLGMGGDIRTLNVANIEPNDANWAVVERLAHWQAGWYMFAAKPWLGVGIGNYEVVYSQYALPQWPLPLGHAHNYYLNTTAETGLIGLTAYLGLNLYAWLLLLRGWRSQHEAQARALLLSAAGSLMYLCVHSFFDNLYVHGMQIIFAYSLGVIALAVAKRDGEAIENKE